MLSSSGGHGCKKITLMSVKKREPKFPVWNFHIADCTWMFLWWYSNTASHPQGLFCKKRKTCHSWCSHKQLMLPCFYRLHMLFLIQMQILLKYKRETEINMIELKFLKVWLRLWTTNGTKQLVSLLVNLVSLHSCRKKPEKSSWIRVAQLI